MPANPDFRDLFAAFNAARVRYLLVGGYALAFHGRPRFTRDLDVWIDSNAENAAKTYAALGTFGAPLQELQPGDLGRPGLIFQIPERLEAARADPSLRSG
jgi:hypothetical protein